MSDTDDTADDTPQYSSPKRCLARSFRLSRDRWKAKATERRQQIKALQVKARDLEVSRDLWKAKALQLQAQLAALLGVLPPRDDDDGDAPRLDLADQETSSPADPTPPALPAAAPAEGREDGPPKKARRARR